MRTHQSFDTLEIEAPAKVNLFLEVIGRRPDGYHELESIFQTISICDTLRITLREEPGVGFSCSRKDLETADNLAVRAAAIFFTETGRGGGVDIELEKVIPVGGGLGGGSSDAASVLVGLNELTGAGLSAGRLRELGAVLGSDVPFFVEGGSALVRGRGERVENGEFPEKLYFVVIFPGFSLSTAAVYKNLSLKLTHERNTANVVWGLLSTGRGRAAESRVFNRLEQAAFALDDRLRKFSGEACRLSGGEKFTVSGSGASVFSVFADEDRAYEAFVALQSSSLGEQYLAESVGRRWLSAGVKGDHGGDLGSEGQADERSL